MLSSLVATGVGRAREAVLAEGGVGAVDVPLLVSSSCVFFFFFFFFCVCVSFSNNVPTD